LTINAMGTSGDKERSGRAVCDGGLFKTGGQVANLPVDPGDGGEHFRSSSSACSLNFGLNSWTK
jgi:hypothetical protein